MKLPPVYATISMVYVTDKVNEAPRPTPPLLGVRYEFLCQNDKEPMIISALLTNSKVRIKLDLLRKYKHVFVIDRVNRKPMCYAIRFKI